MSGLPNVEQLKLRLLGQGADQVRNYPALAAHGRGTPSAGRDLGQCAQRGRRIGQKAVLGQQRLIDDRHSERAEEFRYRGLATGGAE